MSNFANSESVILKNVRLAWFDGYHPGKAMEEGGADKYKATGIFAKGSDADKVARAAMIEAANLLWPGKGAEVIKTMTANSKALRDGNTKLDDSGTVYEAYENNMFVSASNKSKPQIVGPKRIDQNGKLVFVDIAEDGNAYASGILLDPPPYKITVPYRGCYVNMKVQFVAGKSFKTPDKKILPNQVFAKIEAIQFVRDGDPFGAGPTSAEGFDDEEVAEADASGEDLF